MKRFINNNFSIFIFTFLTVFCYLEARSIKEGYYALELDSDGLSTRYYFAYKPSIEEICIKIKSLNDCYEYSEGTIEIDIYMGDSTMTAKKINPNRITFFYIEETHYFFSDRVDVKNLKFHLVFIANTENKYNNWVKKNENRTIIKNNYTLKNGDKAEKYIAQYKKGFLQKKEYFNFTSKSRVKYKTFNNYLENNKIITAEKYIAQYKKGILQKKEYFNFTSKSGVKYKKYIKNYKNNEIISPGEQLLTEEEHFNHPYPFDGYGNTYEKKKIYYDEKQWVNVVKNASYFNFIFPNGNKCDRIIIYGEYARSYYDSGYYEDEDKFNCTLINGDKYKRGYSRHNGREFFNYVFANGDKCEKKRKIDEGIILFDCISVDGDMYQKRTEIYKNGKNKKIILYNYFSKKNNKTYNTIKVKFKKNDGYEYYYYKRKLIKKRIHSKPPGYIGVSIKAMEVLSEQEKKALNLKNKKGLFVGEVKLGSPAWKAGIRPYDFIIKIDDKTVTKFADLKSIIIQKGSGKKILITVIRKRKERKFYVVIGTYPKGNN